MVQYLEHSHAYYVSHTNWAQLVLHYWVFCSCRSFCRSFFVGVNPDSASLSYVLTFLMIVSRRTSFTRRWFVWRAITLQLPLLLPQICERGFVWVSPVRELVLRFFPLCWCSWQAFCSKLPCFCSLSPWYPLFVMFTFVESDLLSVIGLAYHVIYWTWLSDCSITSRVSIVLRMFCWALTLFSVLQALILTLRTGLPRVLRFIVGVLPVFIGYALLGMALFGDFSDKVSMKTTSVNETSNVILATTQPFLVLKIMQTVAFLFFFLPAP